jgi:hypothetical protein
LVIRLLFLSHSTVALGAIIFIPGWRLCKLFPDSCDQYMSSLNTDRATGRRTDISRIVYEEGWFTL